MLGIKHVFANEADKLTVLNEWCKELNISLKDTAFIGDDINDLKVMQQVGIAACPADAIQEVRNTAHIILTEKGGEGCVREFIDAFIGYKIISIKKNTHISMRLQILIFTTITS